MIRAGQLRDRVTIEDAAASRNEYGEEIRQWIGIAERWCRIEPLSRKEQMHARQTQSVVTHRVTMRVCPFLKSSMRLRSENQVLNIQSVTQTGSDETTVMCNEVID